MQEKPPFSSYFDFFPNVWEGATYPPPAYFDFALRHAPGTHNICFGREIKKIIFQYALLSGGLMQSVKLIGPRLSLI